MTYRHEHAAQFAKEAMMNQSLDQEEILNVRWATEDPNPTAITREKRRIERIGEEALRSKVVHVKGGEVLEAAAVVQALENGDEAGLNAIMPSAEQEDGGSKRARVDNGASGGGLLGSEALEGMRYLLERRKEAEQQAQASDLPSASAKAAAKPGLAGALGGYGSESEDDE